MEKVLQFDPTESTTPEGGVILGHLEGPCADFICPTRNGRGYSETLWDKVFKDPITQEYFDCGGIFGELGHPADRDETDMSKIALCMPKPPKKVNGKLWAKFDILDTPNGRILKTLCKYGYKMGISSRGSGDLVTDYDGNESVDPDTYQFNAFDAVLLPAVKDARLAFTESLNGNTKTLSEALTESYNKASDEDKAIMKETLKTLNIPLTEAKSLDEMANYRCDVILQLPDGSTRNMRTAQRAFRFIADHPNYSPEDCKIIWRRVDTGSGDIESEMTIPFDIEAIKEKRNESFIIEAIKKSLKPVFEGTDKEYQELSESILLNIQEQCKAQDEAVDNDEALVNALQDALKENSQLENEVAKLKENLSVCNTKEKRFVERLNANKTRVGESVELSKKNAALVIRVSKLDESLAKAEARSKKMQDRILELNSAVTSAQSALKESKKATSNIMALQESIATLQKDKELQKVEFTKKLQEAKQIVDKNKKLTAKAVDKYIELQSKRLGVTKAEIKNRLSESYTFDDIDKVCEDMQKYQLNIGQLPFNTGLQENLKVRTTAKKDPILPAISECGDNVDKGLLSLAGLL